jgi:hypothetical protein
MSLVKTEDGCRLVTRPPPKARDRLFGRRRKQAEAGPEPI